MACTLSIDSHVLIFFDRLYIWSTMITYANDRSDAYYARRAALRKMNVSMGKVRRSLKYSNILKGLRRNSKEFEEIFDRFLVLFKELNDMEARELYIRFNKIWSLVLRPRSC